MRMHEPRGKYKLQFSFLTRISPGNLPNQGRRGTKEMINPTATSNNPIIISNRPRPLKKKPRKILDASNTFIIRITPHYILNASFSRISSAFFIIPSLGSHKSLTMTLRYSHLAPNHLTSAVNVLNSSMSISTKRRKGATQCCVTPSFYWWAVCDSNARPQASE